MFCLLRNRTTNNKMLVIYVVKHTKPNVGLMLGGTCTPIVPPVIHCPELSCVLEFFENISASD